MNRGVAVTELVQEDISEVLAVVCMTVLALPIEAADVSGFDGCESLTCSISISGAWEGVVQVRAGVDFLNYAAATMFNIDIVDVEHMDRVDTFTELNNMLGGSVKCLLPEPSDLSLPQLIEADAIKGSSADWHYFLCNAKPLALAVVEAVVGSEKAA